MKWPWGHRQHVDMTAAARAALARTADVDVEVRDLGRALRDIQRANHFSAMVSAAIARTRAGSRPDGC